MPFELVNRLSPPWLEATKNPHSSAPASMWIGGEFAESSVGWPTARPLQTPCAAPLVNGGSSRCARPTTRDALVSAACGSGRTYEDGAACTGDVGCDRLGHRLRWRHDEIGQAALACPQSSSEIVLTTQLPAEPNWLVRDAVAAAKEIEAAGGRIIEPSIPIPVGHVSIAEDPFGNRLVLVDLGNGLYQTDESGLVTGVQHKD
ncbi:VOC family protein [Rathayibacter sp. KR2-224]|uniref:VOC family protein n=1 Tax=Rathayibacter sp. KR2-224 TaxID=3400913 RepID=UPI003C01A493